MNTTHTPSWIQPLVSFVHDYGIEACEMKAWSMAHTIPLHGPVANIGGGCNLRWPHAVCVDAAHEPDLDFNTKAIPFEDSRFSLVVCEQVIEHLHNTTWFLKELYRILLPGGYLLLSTENLASLPNLFALLLGRAPFSTQPVCGKYVGGWKDGSAGYNGELCENHPTYSGMRGHVRVLTVKQIRALLTDAGFCNIQKHGYAGNHYVLFVCRKTA